MSESDTSPIEELLRYDEEPPRQRRERVRGAGCWVRGGLSAGALTAVTVFGLRLFSLEVSVVVVFAGFTALLVLRQLAARVVPPAPAREYTHGHTDLADGLYHFGDADGLRVVMRPWELKLDWSYRDPDRFSRAVLPAITQLVDERLRLRHGLTRASDPTRARALLGEPLWAILTDPSPRTTPTPRAYADLLVQLEKI